MTTHLLHEAIANASLDEIGDALLNVLSDPDLATLARRLAEPRATNTEIVGQLIARTMRVTGGSV